jgi:hypothetical protein
MVTKGRDVLTVAVTAQSKLLDGQRHRTTSVKIFDRHALTGLRTDEEIICPHLYRLGPSNFFMTALRRLQRYELLGGVSCIIVLSVVHTHLIVTSKPP